eukprot:2622169-Pleurochrysis_carterae.AAC.1
MQRRDCAAKANQMNVAEGDENGISGHGPCCISRHCPATSVHNRIWSKANSLSVGRVARPQYRRAKAASRAVKNPMWELRRCRIR